MKLQKIVGHINGVAEILSNIFQVADIKKLTQVN